MRATESITIYRRIGVLSLLYLALLSASRLLLIGVYFERVSATGGIATILLQGIRFDIILLGLVFGPVLMLKPWLHLAPLPALLRRWLLSLTIGAVSGAAFFVEASTSSFVTPITVRSSLLIILAR